MEGITDNNSLKSKTSTLKTTQSRKREEKPRMKKRFTENMSERGLSSKGWTASGLLICQGHLAILCSPAFISLSAHLFSPSQPSGLCSLSDPFTAGTHRFSHNNKHFQLREGTGKIDAIRKKSAVLI